MDEDQFLRGVLPLFRQGPNVAVGPGDDCAAIRTPGSDRLTLLAVDQLIAGRHYSPETAPERAGAKLLKRNVSDIAAMGGRPEYALVTIAASPLDAAWMERFYRGLATEAERWDVSVCGGDIASLGRKRGPTVATLSIVGGVDADRICLRSGARPGDWIYVTGAFGDSFGSEHHLDFAPRVPEATFLAGDYARAMIDVSDGLLMDLGRMAMASGLGAMVEPDAVPRRNGVGLKAALTDGEDYELVCAVPPERAAALENAWPFPKTPLTRLGRFLEIAPGAVVAPAGDSLFSERRGFDHFA